MRPFPGRALGGEVGGDLWRLEQEGEFLDVHHRCHGAQALGGAGLQEGRVLGAGRQGLLNAKALDSPTGLGRRLPCCGFRARQPFIRTEKGRPSTAGVCSDPLRPPGAARPFMGVSASAGSQAGPGSGPAGHAAHQGGEGLPPKLRWSVWLVASDGARPLPSQPVSCMQPGQAP